jgi:1,4-alpha-glucan branching enzyme
MINEINSAAKESQEKSPANEFSSVSSWIKKRYLIGRNACAVNFRLAGAEVPEAKHVALVGDFNDWNAYSHPMRKKKNGDYGRCLRLEAGRHYQFRYIVDGIPVENDTNTDRFANGPYTVSVNSVVVV